MANWTQITIPETPTPQLVHVTHIAPGATDDKIKEFFLFCGKINEFEVISGKNGNKQALILFEKESAAKTATMLSNAVITDQQIGVQYYFKDQYGTEENNQLAEAGDDSELGQEEKAKSSIVAELLYHGFALSERVINAAQVFDRQYGVSDRARTYYEQALAELGKLDEKYKAREMVITRVNSLNETYSITDTIYYAAGRAQTVALLALESPPGQRATELLTQAKTRAIETVNESRKIADARKV